ncbi:MAG: hypothetical protein NC925_04115 [Candidatus Omnitrophica bacterium]|nr:hypothetical protein [Candidatus Omnitrophota bacterium]MCM8830878.1 hypothetical protein [Candidatus Omnitrophota bacterium]
MENKINFFDDKGLSLIVKRITRITVSLIFLFGIYIMMHGHITPGGGFAGGVIVALSFIHLVLAFGKEFAFKHFSKNIASFSEAVGGIMFLMIALLGLFFGRIFFLNFLPKGEIFNLFSAGTIIISNLAIFLKVTAGLFIIFISLALFRMEED